MSRFFLAAVMVASIPIGACAEEASPRAEQFSPAAWSPYIGGALIGVLVSLTIALCKKPVGASSSYATAAGLLGKAVAPRHTASLKYYHKNPPTVDWELIFIATTIIGAVLAAWSGGDLARQWVPTMWSERFGDSVALRGIAAFAGGVLMALGARIADGCTSGHGISGASQLNLGSWISLICFFIGGAIVANPLYRL